MQKIIEMALAWGMILVLVIVMGHTSSLQKERQVRVAVLISIIYSGLFSLRSLGMDIVPYEQLYVQQFAPYWNYCGGLFQGLANLHKEPYEPLHYILALLLGKNGFRLYLFLTTVVPMLCLAYVVRNRQNPLIYSCVFILTYFFYFDVSRQMLSLSFAILSLPVSGFATSLLIMLPCLFIHWGSAPGLIGYMLKRVNLSQVAIMFVLVIGLFAGFLLSSASLSSVLLGDFSYLQIRTTLYTGSASAFSDIAHTIELTIMPVSMISIALFTPGIFASSNDKLIEYSQQSFKLAIVAFFVLYIASGPVTASRIFAFMGFPFVILAARHCETRANKEKMPFLFALILLNTVHTFYYMSVYLA